jgi:hypothetical protein
MTSTDSPSVLETIRRRIIDEGIASVHATETLPHKIRGCLAGFEIARTLPLVAFEDTLAARRRQEIELYRADDPSLRRTDPVAHERQVEAYWEYICCTAQIDHVWQRLRLLVGPLPAMISGNAALHVGRLLGEIAEVADASPSAPETTTESGPSEDAY